MWTFSAIPGTGVYWSLTIHRARRDGQRDRRYAVWPCGLWTPAGAHHALNSPRWHAAPRGLTLAPLAAREVSGQRPPARWAAAQRAAVRAGLNFIALGGREE